MKKTYTPEFKTKVVLELLREELTIGQLSSKYEIHQTQLHRWRKIAVEGLPELLADTRRKYTLIKEHEEEVKELYAQIGELSSKLNWLKKKSGIDVK
jgi:putative transposase